jgi:hypothetical protein
MLRLAPTLTLLAAAAILPGCLQRTLTITTTPPGALVWINDVEVGATPLDIDFTFYGGYDVRIRREGYEPLAVKKKLKAPLREAPVIDLAAEAIPVKFENNVVWHFDLTPLPEHTDPAAAEHDLIARATDLRAQVPPAPPTPPASPSAPAPTPAPTPSEPAPAPQAP